ncbi:hypothetical protein SDC9_183354 [bioreactor metagenome]|uniref:Uncharacterized protein n=1 Tax=bioreactor metagenome TaxID=1076179 RepID=A0A645HBW1_9ZZZZ
MLRDLVRQYVILTFDGAKARDILLADQRAGQPAVPRATGSADAVDIVFGLIRHVIVDDEVNVVHVDAACRDVGCDEHGRFARAEIAHDVVALVLAQVAMDTGGNNAAVVELLCDGFHPVARVAKNQRQARGGFLHEIRHRRDLPAFRRMDTHLLHGLGRFVALADLDGLGMG